MSELIPSVIVMWIQAIIGIFFVAGAVLGWILLIVNTKDESLWTRIAIALILVVFTAFALLTVSPLVLVITDLFGLTDDVVRRMTSDIEATQSAAQELALIPWVTGGLGV